MGEAPAKNRKDQEMDDLTASPTHHLNRTLNAHPSSATRQAEGKDGNTTTKAKLSFDLPRRQDDATQKKRTNANPFEALNGEDGSSNFLRNPRRLGRRLDLLGEKEAQVKIDSTCSKVDQPLHLIAWSDTAPRGKKGHTYSKLHHSLFTSLRIPFSANVDHCRTWV